MKPCRLFIRKFPSPVILSEAKNPGFETLRFAQGDKAEDLRVTFSCSFVSQRLMTVHPKIPTSRTLLQIAILTKGAAATGESSHVEVDIPWDGTPLARDSGYLKMTPPHRTSKGEDNSTEEGKEVRIVKHGACHCRP